MIKELKIWDVVNPYIMFVGWRDGFVAASFFSDQMRNLLAWMKFAGEMDACGELLVGYGYGQRSDINSVCSVSVGDCVRL